MKTLFLSAILSLSVISLHAQDAVIHMKAGLSYSYIEEGDNGMAGLGYLAGFDFEQEIIKRLTVTGNLYYLYQTNSIAGRSLRSTSANIGFGLNVYPAARFNLMTGIDTGFVIGNKRDRELGMDADEQRWSYVFGAAYRFSNRVNIQARYLTSIDDQWFDSAGQMAVAYRLTKAE